MSPARRRGTGRTDVWGKPRKNPDVPISKLNESPMTVEQAQWFADRMWQMGYSTEFRPASRKET